MPSKPRTCAQQIALDIQKYTLAEVYKCAQMAWELEHPPAKRVRKAKAQSEPKVYEAVSKTG